MKEKKKITIKEASLLMKKSEQFIRVGLQRNLFPFGTAVKMSSRWSYYISPKLFYEYVGKKEDSFYEEKKIEAVG